MSSAVGPTDPTQACRVVVLISGNGSNLQAILDRSSDGSLPAKVVGVISNQDEAYGIIRARNAGVPVTIVDHRSYEDRAAFDAQLAYEIEKFRPDLIVLAGFMRILGRRFVERFENRIMNIHPSLLPQYPGLDTHARALSDGIKRHGATVHFVTADLDAGPIIVQGSVPVMTADTADSLAERVHEAEHRIYPLAIQWFAEQRLSIESGKVMVDGRQIPAQGISSSTG